MLPGFNTYTPTRVQLVSISYVSVLSPTKVNEARLGWSRFAGRILSAGPEFRTEQRRVVRGDDYGGLYWCRDFKPRLAGNSGERFRATGRESFDSAAPRRFQLASAG